MSRPLCLSLLALLAVISISQSAEPGKLSGHTEPAYAGVYSDDGSKLVTASFDKTLRIWDLKSSTTIRTLSGHTGLVLSVALSNDGTRIVSGSLDKTVRMWDFPLTRPINRFQAHGENAVLAINPEGTQLWTASTDKTIRIWNLAEQKLLREIGPLPEPILRISVRSDQVQVAIADRSGVVRFFHSGDGTLQGQTAAQPAEITALAYAPNQTWILTGSADGLVKKWSVPPSDSKTSTSIDQPIQELRADATRVNAVVVHPNSNHCFTAGQDGIVKQWNVADGSLVHEFKGHEGPVRSLAINPNQQQFASGGADHRLKLWNLSDATKPAADFDAITEIVSLAYSVDQKKLIAAGTDGAIRGFEPTATQPALPGAVPMSAVQLVDEPTAAVTGLSFAPDNRTAVSISSDGMVRRWLISSPQSTLALPGHQGHVYAVAFHPTLPLIVSASSDKTIKVWDYEKNQNIRSFGSQDSILYSVGFIANGSSIVTSGSNGALRIHRLDDGSLTQQLNGLRQTVYSIGIRPDQSLIAAAGLDHSIAVWNLSQSTPLKLLSSHKDDIYKVEFSRNGNRLLSVGYAGNVFLWDLDQDKPVFHHKLPAALYSGTLSPDGRQCALFANDGQIHLVDLPTDAK